MAVANSETNGIMWGGKGNITWEWSVYCTRHEFCCGCFLELDALVFDLGFVSSGV